eukprot:scaffold12829_cov116-Isochrysis_galbana.AAC.4
MPYVRATLSGSSRKASEEASRKTKASKLAAARARTPVPATLSAPMKKAVTKIANKSAARAADKAIPDSVIQVQKTIVSNSGIGAQDVGYFWTKKANLCPITGGLSFCAAACCSDAGDQSDGVG